MGGSGSLLETRQDTAYTVAPMSSQKNPFVMPFRTAIRETPKIDIVLWGIFNSSYSNCAGGKLGTTKVMPVTSRKATTHTILDGMSSENMLGAVF